MYVCMYVCNYMYYVLAVQQGIFEGEDFHGSSSIHEILHEI